MVLCTAVARFNFVTQNSVVVSCQKKHGGGGAAGAGRELNLLENFLILFVKMLRFFCKILRFLEKKNLIFLELFWRLSG